jgi:hypothetical protein
MSWGAPGVTLRNVTGAVPTGLAQPAVDAASIMAAAAIQARITRPAYRNLLRRQADNPGISQVHQIESAFNGREGCRPNFSA